MIFNKFSKAFKGNTGILIRFDDIAPNMNWEMMDKCENLLNKFDIKPVLGVIPNNQDEELLNYPARDNFWNIVKDWKSKNWTIAMHGFSHVYDNETYKKDYFGYGGKSEFFGHSYHDQSLKIKKGLKIFKDNNIEIDTFFAPNHTYDLNTFDAVRDAGILKIIDGYGLSPFFLKDIKFVPQLFYKLYLLPYGIQATQIHVNYWKDNDFSLFEKFIEKNHKKVVSLDYAFSINNNNFFLQAVSLFIEFALRAKRKLI